MNKLNKTRTPLQLRSPTLDRLRGGHIIVRKAIQFSDNAPIFFVVFYCDYPHSQNPQPTPYKDGSGALPKWKYMEILDRVRACPL